ncbi:hypothetical protein A4R35_04635 [Thermogemmatispora tikiterensis]|uniref:Uncharacterized protein n=1 Tax=Thermogemmatispora tikiterensis TaxID=1825093 RepID=A0A328VDC0_9CHLR|nr:hypothetical protein A4R35_04635 [Thermogemmatispora tikiterensis]
MHCPLYALVTRASNSAAREGERERGLGRLAESDQLISSRTERGLVCCLFCLHSPIFWRSLWLQWLLFAGGDSIMPVKKPWTMEPGRDVSVDDWRQ